MSENAETRKNQWSRAEVAAKMAAYEEAYQRTPSQRQVAEELQVPRSTLQHWLERQEGLDAEPEVVAFFESPVGVAFLHRLVLAAHFVITLLGPSGIRRVCLFLELTGLDQFVAASYGAQQQVSVALEESVVVFDQLEQTRLAKDMPPQQITVCEDETFHPAVCLVAIEPVSNFILLEQYADNRKAATWTQAMAAATAELPVEIVQATSDEGPGLLCHVQEDLGAHHSPDVFHVQHELVKGTSGALASKKRQAEEAVVKATQQFSRLQQQKEASLQKEISECGPELDERMEQAQEQVRETQQALATAAEQQERARQAIRGISAVYHPYDLETGAPQSAAAVAVALAQHFAEIEAVAAAAQLSERCVKRIEKAQRVTVDMVATVAFFRLTVRAKVEALSLAPHVEQALYHHLIPAIYLHLVAAKTPDVERRPALQQKSAELLAPLLSAVGPLADLTPEEKVMFETVAQECAQLFQRSSSCVEGRNGYLALHHHSLHRLGDRKLAALTTVHNYFVQRPDGTTAAERFFGAKPRDLFGWVLDQVDLPGRSARKRSRPKPKKFLVQAAA
ncbi:MAG: hypothetical protein KKA73_14860 [Chloroflexi bacterium]|nr:hypothetical protein [Chloroflexota bacterium]